MKSVSIRTIQTFLWAFLWIASLTVVIALVAAIFELDEISVQRQLKSAAELTSQACAELAKRFQHAEAIGTFSSDKRTAFQSALLEIVLDRYEGVEGGFWSASAGFTAYAFPTYEGSGRKTDVPEAEKPHLAKVAATSIAKRESAHDQVRGRKTVTLVSVCPISDGEVTWTMQRSQLAETTLFDRLRTILVAAIALVLLAASAISYFLNLWSRNHESLLTDSRRSDRLRSLGEMSSGLAHDLRNPIGTMRLKFENLLVDPAGRAEKSAPVIFDQMDRLDRMIEMMLAMSKPFELQKQNVRVSEWLEPMRERFTSLALAKQIELRFECRVEAWKIDSLQLGRALNNLIENALAHTPKNGSILVDLSEANGLLALEVKDSGQGVDPSVLPQLFQPFHSGRSGGNGLGLALAREIAQAHGGDLKYLTYPPHGSVFRMEIPS